MKITVRGLLKNSWHEWLKQTILIKDYFHIYVLRKQYVVKTEYLTDTAFWLGLRLNIKPLQFNHKA